MNEVEDLIFRATDPESPESLDFLANTLKTYPRESFLNALEKIIHQKDPCFPGNIIELISLIDPELCRDFLHLWIYEAKYQFTVCTWLYSEGSQESTPHLVHVLKQSEDEDVRYSACEALTVWGDRRALSALDHAAQHDNGCDYEERPIKEVARKAIEAIQQRYPEEF